MASPRKPRRSGQDLMAISVAVNGRPARQRAYLEIIRQKARSWECNQQDRHYSRNRGRMSSARRRRCSSCLIVPSIRARYGASCIAPERPPRYDVCIFVLCMPTRNKITPTATKSLITVLVPPLALVRSCRLRNILRQKQSQQHRTGASKEECRTRMRGLPVLAPATTL